MKSIPINWKTRLSLSVLLVILVSPVWALDQEHTIDPDGTGDYVSLAAWDAANAADITGTTNVARALCISSGGTADTAGVEIDDWTTDATHYVEIKAGVGHAALKTGWDATRYRIIANAPCLYIEDDFVRIIGLQINRTDEWSYCVLIGTGDITSISDIRIDSCLISASNNNTNGIKINEADANVYISNTLITNENGGLRDGVEGVAGNCWFDNCVIFGANDDGIETDAAGCTVIARNTAILDCADDVVDGGGILTLDFCASDDNEGTNNVAESGGGAGWPNDFTDAANHNFTLKSSSNLVNAGTDSPAIGSGPAIFSDDIEDDVRATWDVGVDEYVAAGGAVITPQTQLIIVN